jgi:hypothetical protein
MIAFAAPCRAQVLPAFPRACTTRVRGCGVPGWTFFFDETDESFV